MAGLTWKMWLIGCYGVFCCILLLQVWPVDGLRLNVADKLHHRGRSLMQTGPAPAPLTSPPSPPEPPASPPDSESSPPTPAPESSLPLPPESSPPPLESSPPPQSSVSPPPLPESPETISSPTSPPLSSVEPPPSPPPESPPPVEPELPVEPPSVPPPIPFESPPPPVTILPPTSPAPTITATPDAPPPSETPPPTPNVLSPPAVDAPPPSTSDSPPPPAPDAPPPPASDAPPPSSLDSPPPPSLESPSSIPNAPPPSTVDSPPPAPDAPPPTTPDASPPALPDAPPPAVPDAPPPSTPDSPPPLPDAPPPSTPDSPPPPSPDAPPPSTRDSPPPPSPDAPPPLTPASPPPPSPDASPPLEPDAPSPSITPPPTLSPPSPPVDPSTSPPPTPTESSPPSSPPATSPPSPTSIPPEESPPVSSPPPVSTSPPEVPPATPPETSPPSPPSEPPTDSPSPPSPTPEAPGPSPTTLPSPPSVLLAPPPRHAPPPSTRSPPSSDSPPPSSPESPPPPPPDSRPPESSPDPPPPLSPNSPPTLVAPPPADLQPAAPPSTPPAAPPVNVSPLPPLAEQAPPPSNVSPPPPSPIVTPPEVSLPARAPPPASVSAPPPYALAPGPAVQGCCPSNMMLQPGSVGTVECRCVYPITVKLQFANASGGVSNLQDIFQTDLASELSLLDVQVFVNFFKFGENSSFSVKATGEEGPLNVESDIGSTTDISFSFAEISRINQTIRSRAVRFNRTYFGEYSVISVTPEFIPTILVPAPAPVATPSPTQLTPNRSKSSSTALYAGIGGGVGAVVLCLLLALCIWNCVHSKKRNRANDSTNSSKVSALQSHQLAAAQPSRWVPADSKSFPRPKQTREFTYEELSEATNGFAPSAFIGEGGFGKVYRGVLKDGTEVAIKKLTTGGHQGDREFLVEVEMLSRLHHRHLVKLLGYFCSREPLVQLLCYELIPNGSVDSWLHGPLGITLGPLDWPTRIKIAIGSARGLQYLHEDSQPCVIHRDFKASNILLHNNFHAKVADFGLARLAPEGQGNYVSTRVMGTFGYVAPEYAMTGHLLVKSDVYSYGVVLLELLSGRKPIDYAREDFENITTWARPLLTDKNRIFELADPRLEGKFPPEDFEQVAALAKTCIEPEWRARPTMGEVVASLNQICWRVEYNTSSDGERATSSSEHETGNLRSVGLPRGMNSTSTSSNTSSVFTMPWPGDRRPSTSYVSDIDPSTSTPASGNQYVDISGLVNDPLSTTNILSEDLQEGR